MDAERKDRRQGATAGFTLVELMVVISIIAILATIVGYNVLSSVDDAAVTQAKAQIRSFKTALMAYRIKYNRFPSASEGLGALLNNEKSIKFLDSSEIPKDPWGNDYVYASDSSREFSIISYGADGRQGGAGYDEDIDSNNLQGSRK